MGSPLRGSDADIYVSSSPSIALTNEATTDAGDHTNYTVTNAAHQLLDPNTVTVVQCSPDGASSWATVTDYTIAWPIGRITFTTARSAGANNLYVRVQSGAYYNVSRVDECSDWSLSLKQNMAKTTPFQAQTERNTPTIRAGSGKIGTFIYDDTLSGELGNLLLFQLYVRKAGADAIRWQFYGYLDSYDPKAAATGLVTQDVSFVTSGDAYFVTS